MQPRITVKHVRVQQDREFHQEPGLYTQQGSQKFSDSCGCNDPASQSIFRRLPD